MRERSSCDLGPVESAVSCGSVTGRYASGREVLGRARAEKPAHMEKGQAWAQSGEPQAQADPGLINPIQAGHHTQKHHGTVVENTGAIDRPLGSRL
jgi:hypothetical protein